MGNNAPSAITTATGSRARQLIEQNLMYPFLEGISVFGERALENPSCVQKTFCEVTKGNARDSSLVQKALYTASSFISEDYLENYGVKKLFDSMADGNCEKTTRKEQQKENSQPLLSDLWFCLQKEPSIFSLVSAVPITILLRAILPTLAKNKFGTFIIITSAIGNKAGDFTKEEFLTPQFSMVSVNLEKEL
ncbi:uncharacterized protein TNCT_159131 [Trichonephila clavata]|uniref:Uncharacterized protein n=1 Tax=Trichonephila clavata TaxID=2740835 RepID=A0A8X6LYR7_TRICU|nr:uncharacterized protein TNCT_159131 [Trichonephila clavata]